MATDYLSTAALSVDISKLPTRIEDIPKDILRLYGIILNDDEALLLEDNEDDSEPGDLIIDEDYEIKPDVEFIFNEGPSKKSKNIVASEQNQNTNLGNSIPSKIFFCYICKKLTADLSEDEHRKKHCFLVGCPELILNEKDRERHKRIHAHPTKPMQCKVCKKRYRYYSYIEKHMSLDGMCKVKRNNIAKENWKKMSKR